MMRGRIAHAPMSQPASPTLLNRKATLAPVAASRRADAIAMMAPAPAQMPSTAATSGCGQARLALTAQPKHGIGDFSRGHKPALRIVLGKLSHRLFAAAAGLFHDGVDASSDEIGIRETRTHRVHGDPRLCEFQRE